MLGLLLLFFIGKHYYKLAEQHGKHKWGFAILGVVSYYAGVLLGGVILGITLELASPGSVDEMSDLVAGLISIPFGLLACWGLAKGLKSSWSKSQLQDSEDVLDVDFVEEEK